MWRTVIEILTGGYLLYLSVEDIRYRSLPVKSLCWGILTAALIDLVPSGRLCEPIECIRGAAPGTVLLLLSALSGMVGPADGIVFIILGLLFGLKFTGEVLVMSSFLSSIHAVYLWIKSRTAKIAFPFVPFVALSFALAAAVGKSIV